MDIVLATANPHKVQELRAILEPVIGAGRVLSLSEACAMRGLAEPPEPEESGATFEENARLKAVGYAAHLRLPCLADDSGLEVDALRGAPGVDSAHYAGREGTRDVRDARNNARLLAELRAVPPGARQARFVCAMCLADGHGRVMHTTRGSFEGVVAEAPRGCGGFGYDSLLWLPEAGCTCAELSAEEKNRRSHRGEAARLMAQWLRGPNAREEP
jgi:XTP/dITP diphosphohydrolase